MLLAIRRFLAVLAGVGLAASIVAYIGSYFGMTMDSISRWAMLLHVGVFVLVLPMFAAEHSKMKDQSFFWTGFAQNMPKWIVPSIKVLGLFFAFHFVLFLVQSHAASPEIKDGEFVLNNHGQIVKVLTQSEYVKLKGSELRLFTTLWMFFYFVPTTYWWFPRRSSDTLAEG